MSAEQSNFNVHVNKSSVVEDAENGKNYQGCSHETYQHKTCSPEREKLVWS